MRLKMLGSFKVVTSSKSGYLLIELMVGLLLLAILAFSFASAGTQLNTKTREINCQLHALALVRTIAEEIRLQAKLPPSSSYVKEGFLISITSGKAPSVVADQDEKGTFARRLYLLTIQAVSQEKSIKNIPVALQVIVPLSKKERM